MSDLMMGDLVTVRSTARDVHPRWRTELLEVFDVSDTHVYVRCTSLGKTSMVGAFEAKDLERVTTVITNDGQVRVKEGE